MLYVAVLLIESPILPAGFLHKETRPDADVAALYRLTIFLHARFGSRTNVVVLSKRKTIRTKHRQMVPMEQVVRRMRMMTMVSKLHSLRSAKPDRLVVAQVG